MLLLLIDALLGWGISSVSIVSFVVGSLGRALVYKKLSTNTTYSIRSRGSSSYVAVYVPLLLLLSHTVNILSTTLKAR